jgi:hypothetical protein
MAQPRIQIVEYLISDMNPKRLHDSTSLLAMGRDQSSARDKARIKSSLRVRGYLEVVHG